MMVETYTNQLYLSRKVKPKAMTAKDGTFGLLLLAYVGSRFVLEVLLHRS